MAPRLLAAARHIGQSDRVADTGIGVRPARRWAPAIGAVIVSIGAVVAGFLGMIWAVSIDGVAPDDYDSGNRFAIFGGIVMTVFIAGAAGLAAFGISWTRWRRLPLATMIGLTPSAVALLVIPGIWNG
jgi:hypothetical protein